MKISNKMLQILMFSIALLINSNVFAIDFKTEKEKGVWIKSFFKDKEMAPIEYPMKATEEEKKFRRQIIKDFISQNGIEHIEPIARGKTLTDPEIAQYNKACPGKKPIDMHKWWPTVVLEGTAEEIEETLEDAGDEFASAIDINRCNGKMKIYRFNLFNTSDNKQEYILYCDDYREVRMNGKLYDINRQMEDFSIVGSYLHFDPNKCLYSQKIFSTRPLKKEAVSGVFKYQDKNYFYEVETTSFRSEGEVTNIFLKRKEGVLNAKFFSAKTKGRLK
ncbi:MAG TPA: hypothetical protein LFW13_02230 [Rickettsia endosymbiont of Sericostoma sp.]|nr:hypothetical protein [Rickettsia endosymbiont of Sericostoma sp.]